MKKQRCGNCIYRWTGLCPRGGRGTLADYLACKFFLERQDKEPEMPSRPNPDTQEGRLLAVLEDGFSHTLYDWSDPDRYTGRNAVSRLKKRGYPIISWFSTVHGVQAYRLPLSQGELQFAD